jgi:hypothetical protein
MSASEVEMVMGRNMMRVAQQVWPAAPHADARAA